MMIEKAIKNLDNNIDVQINVLSTGRNLAVNAAGFCELVKAREILLGMNLQTKVSPAKKEVTQEGSLTCEHCGQTGLTKLTYGRWHGDKCKGKK